MSLRSAHGFLADQSPVAKRAYRSTLNWLLRRRFGSTRFISLRDLHPELGGSGFNELAAMAGAEDIEVMVHPAWEDEREVLLSPAWRQALQTLRTGSHADLR